MCVDLAKFFKVFSLLFFQCIMTNLWNKSHLAIGDLPGSSWWKLMSGELKQLLLSSSSFDLVLIFSPIHVSTRLHEPIPDSIQSFTSLNSKTFCLNDLCHTLECTPVANDVKARLLAGFFLLVWRMHSSVCSSSPASVVWVNVRHSPSLRHKTIKTVDTELFCSDMEHASPRMWGGWHVWR